MTKENEYVRKLLESNPWLVGKYEMKIEKYGRRVKVNFICINDYLYEIIAGYSGFHWITITEGGNHFMVGGDVKEQYLNIFNDWTKPTQEENDYFNMLYGRKLPWSEEKPFVDVNSDILRVDTYG